MKSDNDFKPVWCIIGGGNGGHAVSGHLSLMGFEVRLYDIFPETVDIIQKQGGIEVEGSVNGFAKISFATTDLGRAVKGADIVMIVAPAVAHKKIASDCSPLLEDGQTVVIHPGATCGAMEFVHVLRENKCKADVSVAETNSLLYACRLVKPGHVNIFGIKNTLLAAALPSSKNEEVINLLNSAFPQIVSAENVLQTSLDNLNAVMHPTPTILNTSMIESKFEWLYYYDGITPTIGEFVEALDQERIEIGRAYGLELLPILDWYKVMYDAEADNLSDAVKKNKAYAGVKGQKNVHTRYLEEDIPMGLVPLVSLGRLVGKPAKRAETVIKMGEYLLNKNFMDTGRNLVNLGLADYSVDDIMRYLKTGSK